jgi:hypothetical protein
MHSAVGAELLSEFLPLVGHVVREALPRSKRRRRNDMLRGSRTHLISNRAHGTTLE